LTLIRVGQRCVSDTTTQAGIEKITYYARPPQTPSRLINRKTKVILRPSESAGKNPMADSDASVSRIKPCKMEGSERKRDGSGGRPMEIDEREKNTVVW
jgi:hypothetical protein